MSLKIRQKELSRYGISMTSSAVLRSILRLGENATLKDISNDLFLERHSIREQLLRMEKDGLVELTKDKQRKNLVRMSVTDKGKELSRKANKPQSLKYIMSALTEEEQIEFWRLLSKIRERCLKRLRMKEVIPFPPSDLNEY